MLSAFTLRRALGAAVVVSTLAVGNASAALVDRGGGVVYDTGSGLDWERSPNPEMVNWHEAKAYVAALALDGGGWRLPSIDELIDVYGQIAAATGCVDCSGDRAPFEDLELGYWTPTQYFAGQAGAYYVAFYRQAIPIGLFQTSEAWVMGVREGAPLPEPGSAVLAAVALGGLMVARRRRPMVPPTGIEPVSGA
jgi:hypothetical protein